jgi:hypothetical protein
MVAVARRSMAYANCPRLSLDEVSPTWAGRISVTTAMDCGGVADVGQTEAELDAMLGDPLSTECR